MGWRVEAMWLAPIHWSYVYCVGSRKGPTWIAVPFRPVMLLLGLIMPTALSSCVIGYPCPIFKFTPILSVVSYVTVVATKFKGPTFFNCMTVSITMLIVFVCGIIRHIVWSALNPSFNRKKNCWSWCYLSLCFILNNLWIGLANIKQWRHHEDVATNTVVSIIEAHKELHHSIFFLLCIVCFHLVTCERGLICF